MKRANFLSILLGSTVLLSAVVPAPASAGVIANRQNRQQQRIGQGGSSGQLTARETARLERRGTTLNREIGTMRGANGGTLTPSERALVTHQQNRLSRS